MDQDQTQMSQENQESSGSKTVQFVIIAIVLLALLGGGFYFLSKNKSQAPEATVASPTSEEMTESSPEASTEAMAAASPTGKVDKVTVSGSEFSYSPSKVTVNKGDNVMITFKNTGKFPHNFTIDELSVASKTIQPGESDTVEFVPSKAGSFSFYCSVDSHKDRGMIGTLVVK